MNLNNQKRRAFKISSGLIIACAGTIIGFYFWYVQGFNFLPHKLSRLAPPVLAWESKAPMPTARSEVGTALLGAKIYVVGGLNGFAQTLNNIEEYDIAKDTWKKLPGLPEAVNHTMVAANSDTLYVFGGFAPLALQFKLRGKLISKFRPISSVYAFDFTENKWARKSNLPIPQGAGAAVAFGDKIYLFGGLTGIEGVDGNKTFAYDPKTDSYEEKAPMSIARDHLTAQPINNLIYVVGGRVDSFSNNKSTLEIYNPVTNSWTIGPPMPTARGGIASGVIYDKLYVFGGEASDQVFPQIEVFDPLTQVWGELATMPNPRHGLGSASYHDTIYALGGGKHPRVSITKLNEAFSLRK